MYKYPAAGVMWCATGLDTRHPTSTHDTQTRGIKDSMMSLGSAHSYAYHGAATFITRNVASLGCWRHSPRCHSLASRQAKRPNHTTPNTQRTINTRDTSSQLRHR